MIETIRGRQARAATQQRTPLSAGRAPDGLVEIGGDPTPVSSLWRARPLVLTFASTGCPACEARLDLIQRVLGHRKDIRVVYVYGEAMSADLAARHYAAYNCAIARDLQGGLAQQYGVRWVPSSFLIVRGRLVPLHDDGLSQEEIDRMLQSNWSRLL